MLGLLLLLSASPADDPGPWPGFLGPGRESKSAASLPADFDPSEDLLWRADIGFGYGSPILIPGQAGEPGAAVIAELRARRQVLRAYDLNSGELRWEHRIPGAIVRDGENPGKYASATPVTDGERVIHFSPFFGLTAVDLEGALQWELPLAPFHSPFPIASSPSLVDGVVYQLCDHHRASFLVAVEAATGEELWRTPRPAATVGFSSPRVIGDLILVAGSNRASAYRRDSGERVWETPGLAWQSRSSPAYAPDQDMVIIQSMMPAAGLDKVRRLRATWAEALAQWDADGDGKLSKSEVEEADVGISFDLMDMDGQGYLDQAAWERLVQWTRSENGVVGLDRATGEVRWRERKAIAQNATPVVLGDRFVLLKDGGLFTVRNVLTGKLESSERLDLGGEIFATPLLLGDEWLLLGKDGDVWLGSAETLKPRHQWNLGEALFGTPAAGAGRLILRGENTLFAYRQAGPRMPARAIQGVHVVLPGKDRVLEDHTVLIRAGRIEALGPRDDLPLPPNTIVLEGEGRFLLPGLVDLWAEFADEHELLEHLASGVTRVHTPDGRPDLLAWRTAVESGERRGPHWTIHGPAMMSERKARKAEASRFFLPSPLKAEDARQQVEAVAAAGYDGFTMEVAVSKAAAKAVSVACEELDVPWDAAAPYGFAPPAAAQLRPRVFARAESLFGMYEGRAPRTNPPDPAKVADQLRRAGVPLIPMLASYDASCTALEDLYRHYDEPGLSAIGRTMWRRDAHDARRHFLPDLVGRMGAVREFGRALTRELHERGGTILVGSDAVAPGVRPGSGLWDELEALIACGMSPGEVWDAASRGACELLGVAGGVIEPGAPADLVLLAANPLTDWAQAREGVSAVVVAGRLHERGDLEQELLRARAIYDEEWKVVEAWLDHDRYDLEGWSKLLNESADAKIREWTVRELVSLMREIGSDPRAELLEAYADERWPR